MPRKHGYLFADAPRSGMPGQSRCLAMPDAPQTGMPNQRWLVNPDLEPTSHSIPTNQPASRHRDQATLLAILLSRSLSPSSHRRTSDFTCPNRATLQSVQLRQKSTHPPSHAVFFWRSRSTTLTRISRHRPTRKSTQPNSVCSSTPSEPVRTSPTRSIALPPVRAAPTIKDYERLRQVGNLSTLLLFASARYLLGTAFAESDLRHLRDASRRPHRCRCTHISPSEITPETPDASLSLSNLS